MKKTAIVMVVALSSFITVLQAAPKNNTWYAGGKLGWSQFHDTRWHGVSLSSNILAQQNKLGIGAFGGYQANHNIGFEMGYDWLGRILHNNDNIKNSFKAQNIHLTTKINYPIAENLDVYASLGGAIWRSDYSNNTNGKNTYFGISPIFSSGVEWTTDRDITTRLEYQWINNIGDRKFFNIRPDNGMFIIGASYHFNKQMIIPTIARTLPSELQNKNFSSFKSDILFDFNESTLKPIGKQTLDRIYAQLSDLKDSSIMVLGFTDRIGSDGYNKALSEKRVQAIINYLISKGVPSTKISSRSIGKFIPITGNTCDNIKPGAKLISCLAPDRRVEIEVKGIRDTTTQHIIAS